MNANNIIKSVKISSFNCKGLNGNFIYSKFLASISDVSFYSETWTRDFDLNLIKEISPSSDMNFFHKSDMDHTYKKAVLLDGCYG